VKTNGLITSELILIGDYRTLGLSNPRIIDTLSFLRVNLNDPTSSVKALKEYMVLRIRLQSHQVHLTVLQ